MVKFQMNTTLLAANYYRIDCCRAARNVQQPTTTANKKRCALNNTMRTAQPQQRLTSMDNIVPRPNRSIWTASQLLSAARRESDRPGELSSFQEARDFVWRLGLKDKNEWWEWQRSGQRPYDIPSHPERVYCDGGWVSWDDWLGIGIQGGLHVEEFRPFEEARAYVQGLGLKNIKEWMLWSGSGERPKDIPWAPDHSYKEDWQSWEDWLANEDY